MAKTKALNFDIYYTDKRFNRFDKRINDSSMLPENKKIVLNFKKKVFAAGLMSKPRILKYESGLFYHLDKHLQKPFDKATKEDLQHIITIIKESDWADSTKNDFQKMLKRFYKIFYDEEDKSGHPEIVRWIKTKHERLKDIAWADVPHWDDIEKMSYYALNPRDKAFIESLWESGNRIGEHLSLTVGSVEETSSGVRLHIKKSKTVTRPVFIMLSRKSVLNWLDFHPGRNNKDAPLFCKLNDPHKAILHQHMYDLLKTVKKKAGIKKHIHPHNFRHGSASYFSHFLSDAEMDTKYGWTPGSPHKKRYTHPNPRAVEGKLRRMAGEDTEVGVKNIYGDLNPSDVLSRSEHEANKMELFELFLGFLEKQGIDPLSLSK